MCYTVYFEYGIDNYLPSEFIKCDRVNVCRFRFGRIRRKPENMRNIQAAKTRTNKYCVCFAVTGFILPESRWCLYILFSDWIKLISNILIYQVKNKFAFLQIVPSDIFTKRLDLAIIQRITFKYRFYYIVRSTSLYYYSICIFRWGYSIHTNQNLLYPNSSVGTGVVVIIAIIVASRYFYVFPKIGRNLCY